jgi:replicative DNA helicase
MSVVELRDHAGDYDGGYGSGPDRTPPQDVAAEQSVLGAMLLSKDAIADVVETVRESDFYRPAHAAVYAAVLDLYGRGEPADAVTVAAELTRTGEIGRVGGAPYLHTLVASVPTAANADYYARIVRERAVLRRLVEAGTRITQLAYAGEGDVDALVDRAQAAVYDVTDKRTSEDYLPLREIMPMTLEEIEAIASRGGKMTGVPTGFHDLDARMNGMHPGQMVVVAARPGVGKSTIGLDFARSASIKHGLTSAIFSLEMSRQEISMRLLSAEAGVGLNHLRGGTMSDADWTKLIRHMSRVSDAPMFIDDSPNLTMMEIRAKCRRLKQRHDLRLVVIDYLQLMTSGKKVESRQTEVSEFSRSIKLLAKELDVPVVAISQLNRGPEQRTDKKPMISDLRESGCLTAETRVLRADTGAETTMGELHSSGERDVEVWALDDSLRYVRSTLTRVFSTGTREVFRLRLASGKQIRATANHPFLTYEGWRALGDLAPGARLAVPRHVCAPRQVTRWTDAQVVSCAARGRLPDGASGLPKRQIALLLNEFWTHHGIVTRAGLVRATARTRETLDRVSRLLLRFGISAVISGGDGSCVLDIVGVDDQRRFLGEIGMRAAAAAARELLVDVRARSGASTTPDGRVWGRVREVLDSPARGDALREVAVVLEDAELELMATNDVLWDEIVAIEADGVEDVYDATVLDRHNFIADGIAVHNSIEQDADVVLLLHREDMYERESPRAGEADIILAKHRNGPTDTVTVAFQGHYSRFVDMATG